MVELLVRQAHERGHDAARVRKIQKVGDVGVWLRFSEVVGARRCAVRVFDDLVPNLVERLTVQLGYLANHASADALGLALLKAEHHLTR